MSENARLAPSNVACTCRCWLDITDRAGRTRSYCVRPVEPPFPDVIAIRLTKYVRMNDGRVIAEKPARIVTCHGEHTACTCEAGANGQLCKHVRALTAAGILRPQTTNEVEQLTLSLSAAQQNIQQLKEQLAAATAQKPRRPRKAKLAPPQSVSLAS
jgi:hypothetical protein